MKKYPAYRDSGIDWLGKIPCEWGLKRLKTICSFIYGDSLASQDRVEGDIPVYGSNGIVGFHDRAITENPCIVIGRKGSFGKINYSLEKCFPIDTTYFIDKRYASCDLKWLSYILPLLELDKFSKDTGVPGLNREDALNKEIPVCLGEEQKFIADFLDKKTCQIDNLIAEKERLVELLKEERTALINHAVTRGLDPDVEYKDSGIEWLGKIPKHWEIKRLKHVSKKIGSGVTPKGGAAVYRLDGVMFLRSQNIHFDGLRLDNVAYISDEIHEEMNSTQVLEGDVLLNITGASIGRCYYFIGVNAEANVNQHVCIIRPNKNIITKYLNYALSSKVGQQQIFNSQNGISREGLNFEDLRSFVIPTPDITEQEMIANHLDKKIKKIDEQVDREKKLVNYLKEYRTSLISEVVTGKIDVRDTT